MDEPGRSVSEVASAVALQPSNVSAAVRGLCGRGLLEKRADPADRRVSLLHPTARAADDRDAIEDVVIRTVSTALAELPRGADRRTAGGDPDAAGVGRSGGRHPVGAV